MTIANRIGFVYNKLQIMKNTLKRISTFLESCRELLGGEKQLRKKTELALK